MTDTEIESAIVEACETPRSRAYLDSMRISTKNRRDALPFEANRRSMDAIYDCEATAIKRDRKRR